MKETINNEHIKKDINSLSYETISLLATIAIGALLIVPAFMAILSMFKQSIDFTMNIYLSMIKKMVFPFVCSIVFIIYLIVIVQLQYKGADLISIFKKNPIFVLFLLASLWMIASQFYNGAEYAFAGYSVEALGETFGMEIGYFVFILFGATQIKVENHKRLLLRIEILASMILVLAAFILWHTQTESLLFGDWDPRFSSIFSNRNYYGYYLSVSVPVAGASFVYEKDIKWKILSIISFITNTVALSLADTMGAWVGACLAIIFIVIAHIIIEKRIHFQTLILIPVFCLCIYVPAHLVGNFESNFSSLSSDVVNIMTGDEAAQHAGSGRWSLWSESIDVIKNNKFYGVGFEGAMFLEYEETPSNIRPHNEFMQYAMFHGIPMMLLYFAGCLGVFIRALKKRKLMNGATLVALSGALGYLVGSFFGLTVFSTAYFLFAFLGMGYVNDEISN